MRLPTLSSVCWVQPWIRGRRAASGCSRSLSCSYACSTYALAKALFISPFLRAVRSPSRGMAREQHTSDDEWPPDGPVQVAPANQLAAEPANGELEHATGSLKRKRGRETLEPEIFRNSTRLAQTVTAVDPGRNRFLHDQVATGGDLAMLPPDLQGVDNRARTDDARTGCK